jgi:hypothetical protein
MVASSDPGRRTRSEPKATPRRRIGSAAPTAAASSLRSLVANGRLSRRRRNPTGRPAHAMCCCSVGCPIDYPVVRRCRPLFARRIRSVSHDDIHLCGFLSGRTVSPRASEHRGVGLSEDYGAGLHVRSSSFIDTAVSLLPPAFVIFFLELLFSDGRTATLLSLFCLQVVAMDRSRPLSCALGRVFSSRGICPGGRGRDRPGRQDR